MIKVGKDSWWSQRGQREKSVLIWFVRCVTVARPAYESRKEYSNQGNSSGKVYALNVQRVISEVWLECRRRMEEMMSRGIGVSSICGMTILFLCQQDGQPLRNKSLNRRVIPSFSGTSSWCWSRTDWEADRSESSVRGYFQTLWASIFKLEW